MEVEISDVTNNIEIPPASPKVPGFVRFIAMVLIVFGAIYLLVSLLGLLAALTSVLRGDGKTTFLTLTVVAVTTLVSFGLLASGIGLRRMRKWAFYLFTACTVLGLVSNVVGMFQDGQAGAAGFVIIGIQILILIYFYSIRKLFN